MTTDLAKLRELLAEYNNTVVDSEDTAELYRLFVRSFYPHIPTMLNELKTLRNQVVEVGKAAGQEKSENEALRKDNERLREALKPLCAYGIEDDAWSDEIPEHIEDGVEAWEWRIVHTSPDGYLHWDIRQKDIMAARAALRPDP